MSSRTVHILVGLFVIAGGVLLAVIVVLLGESPEEGVVRAETLLEESVAGLSVGSAVRFRGVEVGEVREIGIASALYRVPEHWVVVRFTCNGMVTEPGAGPEDVRRRLGDLVDQGLRMKVAVPGLGLAGQEYLDADIYGEVAEKYPPLNFEGLGRGDDHLYIPSIPGRITRLGDSLERFLGNLEHVDLAGLVEEAKQTLDRLETVFGENVVGLRDQAATFLEKGTSVLDRLDQELPALLETASRAAGRIEATATRAEALLSDPRLDDILDHVRSGTAEIAALLEDPRWQELLTSLEAAGQEVPETLTAARETFLLMRDTLRDLDPELRRGARDFAGVLAGLRRVTENLEAFSRTLQRYPSSILFGEAPPRRKPGR